MKFQYLPILAAGVIAVGCGSKGGDTASNDTTKTSTTTSSTTTGDASTTGTSGTTGSATSSTGTTGTTGTMATPSATPGKPGATPPTAPGKPGPGAGAPAGAPNPQMQMTPAQQKQMQDQAMAKMKENGDKAEKAKKQSIPGVSGKYAGFIDESKIPPQAKTQPDYATKLAQAKKQMESKTVDVASDGSITIDGLAPTRISGYTAMVDGKPAVVIVNPTPKAGMPGKNFAPLVVTDGGKTISLGMFTFKKA